MRHGRRKALPAVRLGEQHQLLPANIRQGAKLLGKPNPRDTPAAEYITPLRPHKKMFFEFPRHKDAPTPAAEAYRDFHVTETALIWASFDVPEKVSIILRDRLVSGDRDAFSPKWLDAAMHWVKEARYWRCIGIERPFHEPTALRSAAWRKSGTDVGNLQMSAAMVDAVRDLERAVRRIAEGLPADYAWDKWGPWGNVDGSRTQYLPRFRHNQVIDPDSIDVSPEDVAEYTTHQQLKERYGAIIFPDVAPLEKVFLQPTNGCVTFADFDENLRQRVAELKGIAEDLCVKLLSSDDIRTMLYLSALPQLDESLANATSWDDVVAAVTPLRQEFDVMVDAARLFSASKGVDELRLYYEEKCGFADFLMTPDKQLTAATLAFLGDMKFVVEQPWGLALSRATVDSMRAKVLGEVAFSVFRELIDLDRDHRRRDWASRFSGEANEEATLDYMLQNFARRTERHVATNEPGEDFDREMEPIGRKVQRRVLDSDKAPSASAESGGLSKLNEFREKIRQRRAANPFRDVEYNQMVRTSLY